MPLISPDIVESGTNANGSYVRFGDGTQECWITIDATSQNWTTALGAFFTPAAAQSWTFPAPFINANVVVNGHVLRPAIEVSGIQMHTNAATSISYVPYSSTNLNGSSLKSVMLRATGRWRT